MKATTSSLALLLAVSTADAAISLSGPSVGAGWIAVAANYDFLDDQQTGDPASDIVGTAVSPGFFTAFDSNYALSPTQSGPALAFRTRLDDAGNGGNFTRNLWIGIDADLNGSVDAFIGVDTQSNKVSIGIYDSGSDLPTDNTGPSNTTIEKIPAYTAAGVAGVNYNYRAVTTGDGGTRLDLTGATDGTDTDFYVSCVVSFTDLAAFLTTELPAAFNATTPFTVNTPIRYVLGTSTQGNSLNQDLGGIDNNNFVKTDTWQNLGGFSPIMTPTGQLVPEVSATLLALIGSVFGFAFNRRR